MARRKSNSPAVKPIQWFDHVRSDLVDVFPNAEGEFIQVWSAPRSAPDRDLLLTYQRTPHGPVSINSRIRTDALWKLIESTGPRRTFYYLGDTHDTRYEAILPSGRLLVADERAGMTLREVWADEFDWNRCVPVGRPLGPRMVQQRQDRGDTIFLCKYQQEWSGEELRAERFSCVIEFRGDEWVRTVEPEPAVQADNSNSPAPIMPA